MKKLSYLIVLLSNLVSSQITKEVEKFTKITSFDQISVELIPSRENKVELSGKNSENIEVLVVKEELKIRMPLANLMKGDEVIAKVYYDKLEAIEANEGSYITSAEPLNNISFDLLAKEGSQIKLEINANKIVTRSKQGAKIILSGKTDNLVTTVSTGGVFDAEKLESKQVNVDVTAGGEASVRASDFVDAQVRAGGTITIFGNPKQVNEKKVLGGKIILSKR